MISSDRNSEIREQQTQIAINTRKGGGVPADPIKLPYDPTIPPDDDTAIQIIAPNFVDNSDFDFSKDGYINTPPVGGDQAEESYNWFRQRFRKVTDVVVAGAPSTAISSATGPFKAAYTYPMDFVLLNGSAGGVALSGTLTRVDDNNATLSAAAQNNLTGGKLWFGEALSEAGGVQALKASGHSLYAANEGANGNIPRWDKTNGWIELGSNNVDEVWDVACPLPLNFVRGGLTFYFRVIISQRPGTMKTDPVRMFAGIWDSTTAEKRFIESSNLDLTVVPVGTTGATSYSYVVIADLDDGTSFVSDVVTIANGNAVLSAANYNRLTWQHSTGVLNFRIFRSVGGVVKRIFTIRNGGHDYNDYGTDEGETPASLPTAGVTRPIAYKVSQAFNPRNSEGWQTVLIILEIPSTYDTSRTTSKQWLRFGIEGRTGSERLILLDRIMFSTSNGGWTRSARDLNKILNQNPSSLPISTSQGGVGVTNCFTFETPIVRCSSDGSFQEEAAIGETEKGQYVFVANRVRRIIDVKDGMTDVLIRCRLSNGVEWECSPSERFITGRADRRGTRIDELTFGDTISSWQRWRIRQPYIKSYDIIHLHEPVAVRTLTLRGGKTFLVGRVSGWRGTYERLSNRMRALLGLSPQFTKAIAHNLKNDDINLIV